MAFTFWFSSTRFNGSKSVKTVIYFWAGLRLVDRFIGCDSASPANELRANIDRPCRTPDSVLKGLLILARNLFAGDIEA
jgi:hypothetical protein